MNKRILSLFLAVLLVCCLAPQLSLGAEVLYSGTAGGEGELSEEIIASGYCGSELLNDDETCMAWRLDSEGVLTISGEGFMKDYSPHNRPPWAEHSWQITRVVVEDGIETIGSLAFEGCHCVVEVYLGADVAEFTKNYTDGVALPNPFAACASFERFTVSADNPVFCDVNGVLFSKDQTVLVKAPQNYGKGAKSYTVPSGVVAIAEVAFEGCVFFENITLPNTLEEIGEGAFGYCLSLKELAIPSGVINIGSSAFSRCTSLLSIDIPSSVTQIGHHAFAECEKLSRVTIANGVATIENNAFLGCTGIKYIYIPDSVTSLGSYAFAYCRGLEQVVIEGGIESINNNTFNCCEKLVSIAIGSSVKSIDDWAFNDCNSLQTVYYVGTEEQWNAVEISTNHNQTLFDAELILLSEAPQYIASGYCGGEGDGTNLYWQLGFDGVLTIGGSGKMKNIYDESTPGWWDYRTSIYEAVIEDGVTSVGGFAFARCENLTDVYLGKDVALFDFASYEAEPDELDYFGFSNCPNLKSITVSQDNAVFCDVDGVVFSKDQKTLVLHPAAHGTSYAIPNGTQTIGKGAFLDCEVLTAVSIPQSVTAIEYAAFCMSGITSLVVPDSVESMGRFIFSDCHYLESVTLPKGLTAITEGLFYCCDALKSVTIPKGVTSIGDFAFEYCEVLESIELPKGLISIGEYAFDSCYALNSITIPNSVTNMGMAAFYDCSALETATLGRGLTTIETGAFFRCYGLKSVVIPNTVTTIKAFAFYACGELTDVYFTGTEEQWNAIEISNIDFSNDPLLYAPIHFNYVPPYVLGDANGDDKITSADAALILRYVVSLATEDDINLLVAKVTQGEGKVSSADAAEILRYVVGLISEFAADE